jgi:UDP-GlcNAc:undecaprenyl-phosphate GlcNAc-1-phosphate transferase
MKKALKKIRKNLSYDALRKITSNALYVFIIINMVIVLFQLLYTLLRFKYLNAEVPLYYTKLWGENQLADKTNLFYIPLSAAILIPFGVFFYFQAKQRFFRFADQLVLGAVTVTNLVLTISLVRIIYIASTPFDPIISPDIMNLFVPFAAAFGLAFLVAPRFIDFFKNRGLVTDPNRHDHPGMLLRNPSVRGGGFIFTVVFLVVALLMAGVSKPLVGIYIGTLLISLLGLLDDYQNTHHGSKLSSLENPIVRIILVSLVVTIPISFGVRIDFISNPFNGLVDFSNYSFVFAGRTFFWAAGLFTMIWFVWVLNVLSWSNGVDGQYGGIVGIAFIVIAILALRFVPLSAADVQLAKVAIVASGAAWGLMKYTWYPSKVMWGFGAMAAGLVIATTSVLVGAKIAVAIIIILIPFLDAIVTVIRRLLKGQNPFKGDKNHLHHYLHKHGWGVRRIAVFYWLTTAVFGFIGIVSADKDILLLGLTIVGLIAFTILALIVSLQLQDKLKRQ